MPKHRGTVSKTTSATVFDITRRTQELIPRAVDLGINPSTEYDRKSKTVEHIPRPDGYNQG